jgi:hypothetical protein
LIVVLVAAGFSSMRSSTSIVLFRPPVLGGLGSASSASPYPYATAPAPGITAPPELVPAAYAPAGVALTAQSSASVAAVSIGKELLPGLRQVSFRLTMTLGADFASRLDRSIRLLGADNIRYLVDEPAVEPSLLAEAGPNLDGWVTFLVPTSLSGPAEIHVNLNPNVPIELVLPVVIGVAAMQPLGSRTPQTIAVPAGADTK